jgi:DNA mismatch repair protein MutL
MGHISEAVTRLALGFGNVGIRLVHNEREVYAVTAQSSLEERITRFFGEEIGSKLVAIQADQGAVKLRGFVADPNINRGNARLQYFFVNGRCIRDRMLGHALQDALHGLLMVGRYAVGFVYLDIPPELVDVNVHPSKAEVRFRDGQVLHHLLRSAVRAAMQGRPLVSSLVSPFGRGAYSQPLGIAGSWSLRQPAMPSPTLFPRRPDRIDGFPSPSSEPIAEKELPADGDLPPVGLPGQNAGEISETPSAEAESPASGASVYALENAARAGPGGETFLQGVPNPAKALQFHDAYIVVEESEGMLVIDQHALHERILYEQLKDRLRQGRLEIQRLLVPEPVDLPIDQFETAIAHRAELGKIGLDVEPFGGTTLLLGSYPAMLTRVQPGVLLRGAVEHLTNAGAPPSVELLLDHLLRLMACHSAVKAGDRLTPQEMDALVTQRHLVADAHHCPHGRPTSLFFSKYELDKQFARV